MRTWWWLALSGSLACSSGDDTAAPPGVDPLTFPVGERGPWNVGLHIAEITYSPLPGEQRTIGLNVWYPTDDTDGVELAYVGLDPADGTFADATPIDPPWSDGFPVHAYTHGDRGYGGTSADLMTWFASHGWVAVAPDHTDNLLVANADPTPQGHWYHRPLDVRTAVDSLSDLAWLGPVDTSAWILSGHSRGGSTVWSLLGASFDPAAADDWCAGCDPAQLALFTDGVVADGRAVAGIPLAGTLRRSWHGPDGHRAVTAPVLAMTGTHDPVGQQEQFDTTDGVDLTWIDLEGGCHQTFALGTCGTLDTDLGYRIVDTWALAFGRHHLLGDAGDEVVGILDGAVEVDPAVHLQHHR